MHITQQVYDIGLGKAKIVVLVLVVRKTHGEKLTSSSSENLSTSLWIDIVKQNSKKQIKKGSFLPSSLLPCLLPSLPLFLPPHLHSFLLLALWNWRLNQKSQSCSSSSSPLNYIPASAVVLDRMTLFRGKVQRDLHGDRSQGLGQGSWFHLHIPWVLCHIGIVGTEAKVPASTEKGGTKEGTDRARSCSQSGCLCICRE